MKSSDSQRASLLEQIRDAFQKLDKFTYPIIYENIQNDEKRYAIVERIINEMYARSHQPNLTQVLNTMEISLSE